jgi:hypothetical protein
MLCDCSVSVHDATLAETRTKFHICDTVWDQEANNYCTHVCDDHSCLSGKVALAC